MKIIIERSEEKSEKKKELKINVGDIVLLNKDNNFTKLGKELSDSGHMFFVSRIDGDKLRVQVISSNMSHVSDKFPSNSPVIDWKQAGLMKPSYINGNSNGWTSIDCVVKKVGSLTSRDFKSVMNAIRHRKFVNQRIESKRF